MLAGVASAHERPLTDTDSGAGDDDPRPGRWWFGVVAVAALALAVRAVYFAEIAHSPFVGVLVGDAQQYDAWARRIAGGDWIGTGAFYQTPLYPYLLAVVFSVAGHSIWTIRALQAVAGASSCVLLCEAGRRFVGPRAGLAAGALLAVYPEALFFDGVVQKSSLDLLLMTSMLAAAGVCVARPRTRWLGLVGVLLGLLMLNRENTRVLFPVAVVWLAVGFRAAPWRRRIAWMAMMTAGAAIVLLPVVVRNDAVSGEAFLSTGQLGPNFYIGNHAGARGGYEPLVADHGNAQFEREDARRLAEQASGRALTDGEVSSYWLGRAFDDIRAHPLAWLVLVGRKLLMTVNAGEFSDTESMQEYALYAPILRGLQWIGFGLILPLAAAGLWFTRERWRRLALLYGVAASLVMSVAAFYVFSRYRFPLVPVLLLFAGAAIVRLPALAGAPRRWAPALSAAALAALVGHLPMTAVSNDTHVNVGVELISEGRSGDAVPVLRRAADIRPDDPVARYNLGVALARAGDPAASVEQFSKAVQLAPGDARTRDALGQALASEGRPAAALEQYQRAVTLQPESVPARTSYAAALWAAGDRNGALEQYRAAVAAGPDDADAQDNLASALQQTGHDAEAMPHYEAALRLDPRNAEAHGNYALALENAGNAAGALDHFRAALALEPDSYGTHADYGDLLLRLGRAEDAAAEYDLALRAAPDDVDTALALWPRLAQAYTDADRPGDAADAWQRAVSIARSAGRAADAERWSATLRSLKIRRD